MLRNSLLFFSLASAALWAGSAGAGSIDFEDLPAANDPLAMLRDEYAHLGVHFSSVDDGATWGGMSEGDPGGWALDGTEGPTFLGLDGQSYTVIIDFDSPVRNVELDVARGAGSWWAFDTFTVTGLLDNRVAESVSVFVGAVDAWTTLSLSTEVNRLHLRGVGFPNRRFGVDNLRWQGEVAESVLSVEIDIRPDSDENHVQLKSRGVLPLVLYGAPEFDVASVDGGSLAFGPGAAAPAHRNGPHLDDVDADGYMDLVIHPRMQDAEIGEADSEACLQGETWDGQPFEGCDRVAPIR